MTIIELIAVIIVCVFAIGLFSLMFMHDILTRMLSTLDSADLASLLKGE